MGSVRNKLMPVTLLGVQYGLKLLSYIFYLPKLVCKIFGKETRCRTRTVQIQRPEPHGYHRHGVKPGNQRRGFEGIVWIAFKRHIKRGDANCKIALNWTVRGAVFHSHGTSNNVKVIQFLFVPFLCYFQLHWRCVNSICFYNS